MKSRTEHYEAYVDANATTQCLSQPNTYFNKKTLVNADLEKNNKNVIADEQ